MKKKLDFKMTIINASCLFLLATHSFANPVCSRTGALTVCGEGTLDHLHVAGKASLDGTSILNTTEIAGVLNAKNAFFNKLKVSGKATLTNSDVKGKVKISGLLKAKNTKFHQKIHISSDKIILDSSYSINIQVDKGGETQVLCLRNNTVIDGDVLFTSNRGIVVSDKSSKIKGHIYGGYLKQYDESNCKGDENE
jgi:hypothetical protein